MLSEAKHLRRRSDFYRYEAMHKRSAARL